MGTKRQTLSDVVASINETADSETGANDNYAIATKYEDENSRTGKLLKVRKYQLHPKTYSPKWEQDPNYRGWVQRSEKGDGFYYCLACNQDYTCGKSELDKHASSKKHCMNVMSMPKQIIIGNTSNQTERVFSSSNINCHTYENESVVENEYFNASSTSLSCEVSTFECKEEAFGKYVISELKRIKKKKTYELVKWEILQALQKAMLQEAEAEDSED